MKIVYHPEFTQVYASDPAAAPGRMESILKELAAFEFVRPEPVVLDDLRLVHAEGHIGDIRGLGLTYEVALLSAGGASKAAELAVAGEPAFGLIRPPGHHASHDHCWGFCFFNNIAISVARLIKGGSVKTALILDIDLHFGDGTANIFQHTPEVTYFHPEASQRQKFVDSIAHLLAQHQADIIAVSAGFDRHEEDWGGLLTTADYHTIGKLVKESAERLCRGRRYAVLEGGYNHNVLGRNVRAFVQGLA